MLKDGLLDEVRGLLAKGYSADLPSMSAIGYREMTAVVQGNMTLDEAVTEMKSLTHQFVRRQANWFKETNPDIHWFNAAGDCLPQMMALIQSGQGWLPKGLLNE